MGLMMLPRVMTPGLGTANLTMLELSSNPQCLISSVQLSGGFQDVPHLPNDRCVLFSALVGQMTLEPESKGNRQAV